MYIVSFLICTWVVPTFIEGKEDIIWEIPFEKSKVVYHHSKVCITTKGATKCIRKDKEPGDPQEVADMFKVVEMHSVLDDKGGESADSNDDGGGNDRERPSGYKSKGNRRPVEEDINEELNDLHTPAEKEYTEERKKLLTKDKKNSQEDDTEHVREIVHEKDGIKSKKLRNNLRTLDKVFAALINWDIKARK